MRVYLDVCCLKRPWDDQSQPRIRLESESIRIVFHRIDTGEWHWISSVFAFEEVSRISDAPKRERIVAMLSKAKDVLGPAESTIEMALEFERHGMGPFDALHLACAIEATCAILFTVDDDFIRKSQRISKPSLLAVVNPAQWILEGNTS